MEKQNLMNVDIEGHCSSPCMKLRTMTQEFLDPWGRYLTVWNTIFAVSSVIGVSTDPLFLYTPVLNEDLKCFRMDTKLKIVALLLRIVIDIAYVVHIICQIRAAFMAEESGVSKRSGVQRSTWAIARRINWLHVLIDVLAILPVPQVVIFIFVSRSLAGIKLLNFLLLIQYVPRVLEIHLACKELKRMPGTPSRIVWLNGALNFLLYIMASHVIGALWYFFSIQREIGCWQNGCKKHIGYEPSAFHCNSNSLRSLEFLDEFCPINPPNTTLYDYGIYLDAVQSGILRTIDFPQKFVRSFWWGLRNLSSFGQNLQTSPSVWETCFAAAISIIALFLFLYLIGNLQRYIQMATEKSEEIGQKMKMVEPEIDFWIQNHSLPMSIKTLVMEHVQHTLKHDSDNFDLESLLSFLLLEPNESTENHTCKNEIGRDLMTLEARLRSEEKTQLKKRIKERTAEVWILQNDIPINIKQMIMPYVRLRLPDVKDVDLQTLLSILPLKYKRSIKRHLCLATQNKSTIPILLQNVDVEACDYLKPMIFPHNSYIIVQGTPLDMMLFITQGIALTYKSSSNNHVENASISTASCLTKGDVFGVQELAEWRLRQYPFTALSDIPLSTANVKAHTRVEALVIMAKDLGKVFSYAPSNLLKNQYRFYSLQWRQWGACSVQAAWRRYVKIKLAKQLEEAKQLAEAAATSSSSLTSLRAAAYASYFATHLTSKCKKRDSTQQ